MMMRAAILVPILAAFTVTPLIGQNAIPQQTTAKRVVPVNTANAESIEITIEVKPTPPAKDKPNMQIAILLDTSNSMDGLIAQAKTQLWTIVNQCARATYNGQTPNLTIAVFEYGNTNLPAAEGYIRQVIPFTNDLDVVSQALFSLTTNGGDEYCGQVINESIKRLDWSTNPNDYRAIYIAGNEPFTQGQVPYAEACASAQSKNIIVNTIHCGDYNTGISGMWQHGASLTSGQYMNINQDRKVVHIATPYDDRILELNSQINDTYLWYGLEGARAQRRTNQAKQDSNAAVMGGTAMLSRSASKASKAYEAPEFDLVDALQEPEGEAMLGGMEAKKLPESMQAMTPAQRVEHVKKNKEERDKIRNEIADLDAKRQAFIAEKQKEQSVDTLGDVISITVSTQLKASGFKFETKEVTVEKQEQVAE